MRAGKMKRRVTFQKSESHRGPTGEIIHEWSDFATVWAEIRTISGRERMSSGALYSEATVRIWTRYRDDITTANRILYRSPNVRGRFTALWPSFLMWITPGLSCCAREAFSMNELIGLEEAKLHCRIDDDYEDTLIQAFIDAALEVCQKHIGKRFDNGLEFTPAIKIGCLMYVSQLYEYRTMIGDTDAKEVPMAVSALWSVYRDVGVY